VLLTPALVVLLFISAVGALLGMLLLALYLVALLVGTLVGLYSLGASGLRLFRRPGGGSRPLALLAFVLALIVVALLQAVPLFGFVLLLLLLLAGCGAVQQGAYRAWRSA